MKKKKNMAQGALTIMWMATVAGCSPKTQGAEAEAAQRPMVTVTLGVEEYFAKRLAGEHMDVNVMIPQAADHDTYTPKPGQMKAVSQSSMYLAIGPLEFEEAWRARLSDGAKGMQWVDLSKGVAMQERDPHYWMSPKQAKIMAENMAAALRTLTPAGYDMDSALAAVERDIMERDSVLKQATEGGERIAFLIYHPALSYMARDYGLTQISISKDETVASPKTYKARIAEARAAGVKVIFAQQGYDPGRMEAAAAELNAQQVSITPEGSEWMETMDKIAKTLKAAREE